MSLAEVDHRFLTLNIRRHFYPINSFHFCDRPIFVATSHYMEYWLKLQHLLCDFRTAPMPRLVHVTVTDDDLTLIGKMLAIPFLFFFLFLSFFLVTYLSSFLLCSR